MTKNAIKNIRPNNSKKLLILYLNDLIFWKNSVKHIRSSCPKVFLKRVCEKCRRISRELLGTVMEILYLHGTVFSKIVNYWAVKIRWGCLARKFASLTRTNDCRGSWNSLSPQRTIYNPVKYL